MEGPNKSLKRFLLFVGGAGSASRKVRDIRLKYMMHYPYKYLNIDISLGLREGNKARFFYKGRIRPKTGGQ